MEGSDEAARVAIASAVYYAVITVRGAIAACCIGCCTITAKIAIVAVAHINRTTHRVRRAFSTLASVHSVNADVWL
jgi:hypothetical protein